MTWREYHGITKHSVSKLRRALHVLDWANMPDPFRHYERVPVLDLPADPPAPETPALEVLNAVSGMTPVADGPTFLSQLPGLYQCRRDCLIHSSDACDPLSAAQKGPPMWKDTELQYYVEKELGWEPGLHTKQIGVVVKDGAVQMVGHVE